MSRCSLQMLFMYWSYYFIWRTIIQNNIYFENHLSLHFVLLILSSTCICLCFCKFTSYKNVIRMNHKLRKKMNLVFLLSLLLFWFSIKSPINFKRKNTIQFTRFLLLCELEKLNCMLYAVKPNKINSYQYINSPFNEACLVFIQCYCSLISIISRQRVFYAILFPLIPRCFQ